MHHVTLAEWIDFFLFEPFGWFILLLFSTMGNYLLFHTLCDRYLRRNGMPPLERPSYFDREGGQRVFWRLLTMPIAPNMGAGLQLSLWFNRILTASFILCLLCGIVSSFAGH